MSPGTGPGWPGLGSASACERLASPSLPSAPGWLPRRYLKFRKKKNSYAKNIITKFGSRRKLSDHFSVKYWGARTVLRKARPSKHPTVNLSRSRPRGCTTAVAASNISLDHAFFVCLVVLAGRPASTLAQRGTASCFICRYIILSLKPDCLLVLYEFPCWVLGTGPWEPTYLCTKRRPSALAQQRPLNFNVIFNATKGWKGNFHRYQAMAHAGNFGQNHGFQTLSSNKQ